MISQNSKDNQKENRFRSGSAIQQTLPQPISVEIVNIKVGIPLDLLPLETTTFGVQPKNQWLSMGVVRISSSPGRINAGIELFTRRAYVAAKPER